MLTDDFDVDRAVHGQLQRQVGEGVEAHALVRAHRASHLGLELPVKQVHDHRPG